MTARHRVVDSSSTHSLVPVPSIRFVAKVVFPVPLEHRNHLTRSQQQTKCSTLLPLSSFPPLLLPSQAQQRRQLNRRKKCIVISSRRESLGNGVNRILLIVGPFDRQALKWRGSKGTGSSAFWFVWRVVGGAWDVWVYERCRTDNQWFTFEGRELDEDHRKGSS